MNTAAFPELGYDAVVQRYALRVYKQLRKHMSVADAKYAIGTWAQLVRTSFAVARAPSIVAKDIAVYEGAWAARPKKRSHAKRKRSYGRR